MAFEPRNAILRRFVCLKTKDVGELSETISWARPHRIERLANRAGHDYELCYVPLQESSAGCLVSSSGFRDRIEATDSAFCLLVAFEGAGEHSVSGRRFPLNRAAAAMHSAGRAAEVATSGHCEFLSLTIHKTAIVGELENQLGRPIQAPVEFAPSLNMASFAGLKLHGLAARLCEMLDRFPERRQALLNVAQLERSLVSHLVESQRHNYTRLLNRSLRAAPWQVRAAEAFIHANAPLPLSLGDIASAAGVSVRTLQYSFERHRGIGPMDFLREVRLQHVREELLSSERATTVSVAAARWGFGHFGRFAAEYRKRYAERPSVTLRRNRSVRKR